MEGLEGYLTIVSCTVTSVSKLSYLLYVQHGPQKEFFPVRPYLVVKIR